MATIIALLLVLAGVFWVAKKAARRSTQMKYRVTWTEFRTNSKRVLIIEAETAADAKEVAIDHIERKYGIQSYAIDTVEPYTGPAGRVVNE